MTGPEAITLLNHAMAFPLRATGEWELRVRVRRGSWTTDELEYQAAVRCHRRTMDGRIGKRWGRPIYSDWYPVIPDAALIEAAEAVATAYPEVQA